MHRIGQTKIQTLNTYWTHVIATDISHFIWRISTELHMNSSLAFKNVLLPPPTWWRLWSLCHATNRITDERGNGCRPNLAGMGKGWPSKVINFWWRSGSPCGFQITFHFIHHCGIGDFWTFVSISHTINGRFVAYLVKWVTPTINFVTDPADIQIRINPKIRIRISDHFWLKLTEVWALWVLLSYNW